MIWNWVKPFSQGIYNFHGAFCFSSEDSRYRFLISKQGESIVVDKELFDGILAQNISEAFAMKLLAHGIITINGVPHHNKVLCNTKANHPSVFVVDITKSCNLNDCRTIKQDTLQDICDYIDCCVKELGLNAVTLQLWGGEPICAMSRVRYVSDYFKQKPYSVRIDIETNATLITEEIARELYERGISVGVSIDGTPDIQNLQRPFSNGHPSSLAASTGIQNLRRVYGSRFGGICVITRNNYRLLQDLLSYFVFELGLSSLKFNIVRDNPNASTKQNGLTPEEAGWFAEQLLDILPAFNLLGNPFTEGNIYTKFRNLMYGSLENCCLSHGCTGGIRIISFDMNGNIFPCEMTDYPDVRIGSIYEKQSLISLIENARLTNAYFAERQKPECAVCPWRAFCKGGCTSRMHYVNQPRNVDEIECALNKTIYPRLIERILNGNTAEIIP